MWVRRLYLYRVVRTIGSPAAEACPSLSSQDLKHPCGYTQEVIFLDQFLRDSAPVFNRGGNPARRCLSLAISDCIRNLGFDYLKFEIRIGSTDLPALAGMKAVTAFVIVLITRVDKLVSRTTSAVKLSDLGRSVMDAPGHEDRAEPRNTIEEFDPGSA
jgi:hypothetical protein